MSFNDAKHIYAFELKMLNFLLSILFLFIVRDDINYLIVKDINNSLIIQKKKKQKKVSFNKCDGRLNLFQFKFFAL